MRGYPQGRRPHDWQVRDQSTGPEIERRLEIVRRWRRDGSLMAERLRIREGPARKQLPPSPPARSDDIGFGALVWLGATVVAAARGAELALHGIWGWPVAVAWGIGIAAWAAVMQMPPGRPAPADDAGYLAVAWLGLSYVLASAASCIVLTALLDWPGWLAWGLGVLGWSAVIRIRLA